MSTYTAVHVKGSDVDGVSAHLVGWLETTHASEVVVSDAPFPDDFYASSRFLNSEENPTAFVLAAEPSGWITAYFNSFSELPELASQLSAASKTMVLVVLAQSVSEAHFVAVYEDGAHLRTLYWAGDTGEWYKQEGQPFSFEPPYERFERDELVEFCRSLGLSIWLPSNILLWRQVRVFPKPKPSIQQPSRHRPWWHFWRSSAGA